MKKSLMISAAALIAGSSLALAQGMPGKDSAPAAQSAPAEKAAPPASIGQGQSRTVPEAAQVAPGSSRVQDLKPETTGQVPAGSSQARDATPSPNGKSQTTGQGAAGTSSNLTGEQHSKISTAIKQQNAQPLKNVNFTISIGTAIPRDIRRMPLPASVIEVYPVWRGYEFVLVGDEILLIDPATLRIVAIIEA